MYPVELFEIVMIDFIKEDHFMYTGMDLRELTGVVV